MTATQNGTPQSQSTELTVDSLPRELSISPAQALLERTQHMVAAGIEFPQGKQGRGYYDSELVHVPFAITTEPRYSTRPEREWVDRETGVTRKMPAQKLVQFGIRFYDPATGQLDSSPSLATMGNKYIPNQVSSFTLQELVSCIWTVAGNPKFAHANGYSRMLTPWDPSRHFLPEIDDSLWVAPAESERILSAQDQARGEELRQQIESHQASGPFPWNAGRQGDDEYDEDDDEDEPVKSRKTRSDKGTTRARK